MRKITSNNLTALILDESFKSKSKQFMAKDKAYSFTNFIKGAPVHWEKNSAWSFSDGKTVRYSNIFYDAIMCRFEIIPSKKISMIQ